MIVSETVFIWIVSAIMIYGGLFCIVRDGYHLARHIFKEPDATIRRDKLLGSFTGIAIGVIGLAGVLRYHLGS